PLRRIFCGRQAEEDRRLRRSSVDAYRCAERARWKLEPGRHHRLCAGAECRSALARVVGWRRVGARQQRGGQLSLVSSGWTSFLVLSLRGGATREPGWGN